VSRCHDAGAEEGVEILGTAVRTPARRAPRAMNLARAVVFGAVQHDQYPPTEALERGQHLRRLDRLDEQRIEGRGRGAIQHLADVIVAGDGGHGEQGLAVRTALPLRQGALMGQERRTAHEEERERGQADIGHRVCAAGQRSFATIGKTGTDRAQFANVFLKGTHTSSESEFAARRKAAAGDSGPSAEEGCAEWHLRLTPPKRVPVDSATQSH
jgi:hypothetical protein